MIQLAGINFHQNDLWQATSIEGIIIQKMQEDSVVYSYQSIEELTFELKVRKNIITSARAMNDSQAQFEIFSKSRCNADYWYLTDVGGFQLKEHIRPSDAIRDIYKNSSLYAFECATAKVIIYYNAVLDSIGESLFNQFFKNLYLYSWHTDPDLGIHSIDTNNTNHFIPGDVVYFNNPDVDPRTSWWRGENAVVLEDDTYFGHGLGIKTAPQVIRALNKTRKPEATQSAYLTTYTTRPAFNHLAELSMLPRAYSGFKVQPIIIIHDECSISFAKYVYYLYTVYNQNTCINPFR